MDVSRIDMATTVLGFKISAPIVIAPTSMHQLAHPEGPNSIDEFSQRYRFQNSVFYLHDVKFCSKLPAGEVATARAAAACNTIMVLSFSSTCTIEEVAASCNAVRFFQLYVLCPSQALYLVPSSCCSYLHGENLDGK